MRIVTLTDPRPLVNQEVPALMERGRVRFIVMVLGAALLLSGCGLFQGSGSGPGTGITYGVSGRVCDSEGSGIADVVLTFSGGYGIAKTGGDGRWNKSGLRGTVTITPSKEGYVFVPSSRQVSGASSNVDFVGSREAVARGKLKVSFIGNTTPRAGSRVSMEDLHPFDPSIYAPPFNSNEKGNRVGAYTPYSLVGNVIGMGVAAPWYRLPLSLDVVVQDGPVLLPVFDFAFAKDIVYADYIVEDERYDFSVVEMEITSRNTGPDSNYCFPWHSEVYVDLGERYRDVTFPNEDAAKKRGTVHVFQFADLIPLGGKERTYLFRLSFDHNVDRPYIVNPDGSYVEDFNPYFWDTDTRIGLAGYVIYLPGLNIDLGSGSKHLIFEWDLAGLVEVYDHGTPDNVEDDLVTLRLDNPFPITLRAEPYGDWEPILGDQMDPPDVSQLDIRFFHLINTQVFVRWLNPSVRDFKQTHVIRKEGSPPTGMTDGEEVYVGTFPMYEDNDVELHKDYYYLILAEDQEGRFSDGEVISIRTDPPVIVRIELFPKEVSLRVGETEYFGVVGYIPSGEQRPVVCNWTLNGDIGSLDEQGPTANVKFTAEAPGQGSLTATWNGQISATATIQVTSAQ